MESSKEKGQGFLEQAHWGGISAIVGILALCVAIFVWLVPNAQMLFSHPTSATLPVLKPSYSGTSDCTTPGCTYQYKPQWLIDSPDQNGSFRATAEYPGLYSYSCTGSIASNRSITLICSRNLDSFDFSGKLYPDGHIEGTETDDVTGRTYHDVLR